MKKIFYRKHLPHYQPAQGTFFVTYRLAGSLPNSKIKQLKDEFARQKHAIEKQEGAQEKRQTELYTLQKRYFARFDACLDCEVNGPFWLEDDRIAGVVADSLHFLAERFVTLWAYCIMPNHVHVVMTMSPEAPILHTFMQRHKGFTGNACNQVLKQHGKFWEDEYYDHLVRKDGEFERILAYILNNPVKAKLVENWQNWKWSYVHPDLT